MGALVSAAAQKEKGSVPSSLSRRFCALIVALIVARGVVELCVMPLFEGWDEYQHVAYVVHFMETGQRATLNETLVPSSLLTALREFPQSRSARSHFADPYKPESYRSYWRGASGETTPEAEATVEAPAGEPQIPLYQAQHSVWYYALVGPLFQALGGVQNLRLSVGGLRLLNLAFTAAAVWVALGVVASRVRNRRTAGWIALAIGVHPLFLMNGARVASDAPGVFLAVVVASRMMSLAIDDRRIVRRSCEIGLLAGVAILMKATNLALLPPLAVCWLVAVYRSRPSVSSALAAGSSLALGIGLMIGPELAHNMATYGVLTSMQEAVFNHNQGRGFGDFLTAFNGFFGGGLTAIYNYTRWLFPRGLLITGGWSFIAGNPWIESIHAYCVALALLGWVHAIGVLGARWGGAAHRARSGRAGAGSVSGGLDRVFDSAWTPMICVMICASFTAALIYHAVQSLMAWGVTTTGPWYAAPVIPWFLILVVAGASRWPRSLAPPLVVTLLVVDILAEQAMLWDRMLRLYSGGANGLEALRRITSLQPWFFSTATCMVAALAGLSLFAAAVASIALGRNGGAAFDAASAAGEGEGVAPSRTAVALRGPYFWSKAGVRASRRESVESPD